MHIRTRVGGAVLGAALLATACLGATGCSRSFYRARADRDAYSIVQEKTSATSWAPPVDYDVQPDPRSRLYDPTPIDDPLLPSPVPRLYEYELPALPPRGDSEADRDAPALTPIESGSPALIPPAEAGTPPSAPHGRGNRRPPVNGLSDASDTSALPIVLANLAIPQEAPTQDDPDIEISPITIAPDAWESIPPSCVMRMLEFQPVRDEYQSTYNAPPPAEARDPARRLTFEDIVALALLNSREYQSQKENLYRVALRLTLQRYDYDLKFSPLGNRTALDFEHLRAGDTTREFLRVPTRLQGEQVLATGADLVARFANDVVLTFDGPNGFAADVGSELFFSLSQSILQRDIIFENLTQAERNVVYAAREFARFRKTFFFQLATQYYNLLLTYRQVEIDSQNYFTLMRAFKQREAEYDVGLAPRVQVDQVEQNALQGRSSLIETCNRLEAALDNLKLRIGLPTETPVNLDLRELEQLTLIDELTVAAELVRRVRTRLEQQRAREAPDRAEVLNLAIELTLRMLNSFELRRRLGEQTPDVNELQVLQARLQLDESRLDARQYRAELVADQQDPSSTPVRIFYRTVDLIDALLRLLGRQEQLALRLGAEPLAKEMRAAIDRFRARRERLHEELERALAELQVERAPALLEKLEALLDDVDAALRTADGALKLPSERPNRPDRLQRTLDQVDRLLEQSQQLLERAGVGLVPVDIDRDAAMLTALYERLDLMNQRGLLADDWRRIKLAADDLKSVLNLQATQRIGTRSDTNRPFDFTFDESQTRLTATFDAPLNRRAQRNTFRERLLDYQRGRRNLMQLEDNIKLAVRNDLRDLALAREQYLLGVASAALAFERVASTALQLRLDVAGIEARDFLEAQTAYARSLSTVAARRIGYILTRTELFLDLELLRLDDTGFWPELYDETYQPTPVNELPPYPPYGELPPNVKHSRDIRRMLYP